MGLKVYIRELQADGIAKEWTNISYRVVDTSIKIKEGFSLGGKSSDISNVSLTIRALNLEDAALFHTTDKLVRITNDDVIIFEGFSDGKATVDMANDPDWVHVKISFKSYASLFSDVLAPEGGVVFEGKKILYPSDESDSLVHLLLEAVYDNVDDLYKGVLADFTEKIIVPDGVIRTKTLPIVFVPEGESIFECLETILYENRLAYVVKLGQLLILDPWKVDGVTPRQLLLSSFMSRPTIKQQPIRTRSHMVLSLAEYSYDDNYYVYDSGDPDEEGSGAQTLEPGATYPEDGDPEKLDYTCEEEDEKNIVYAKNARLETTIVKVEDGATTAANIQIDAEVTPTEATVLFTNTENVSVGVQRYRVLSDRAYWKKYSKEIKDIEKEGEEEEYDADYIADSEDAEAFIKNYHMQEYAENADISLSSSKVEITVGEVVQISGLPYKLLCVGVQTTFEGRKTPVYKYDFVPLVVVESTTGISHSGTKPSNGFRYLFLELSQTYFHYNSNGEADPASQVIIAHAQRVNIASQCLWKLGGVAQQGTGDTLSIPISVMGERENLLVEVTAGGITKGLTITRLQDGQNGGDPQYYFQWGASYDVQPDDTVDIITWGDIAIVWDNIAFITNSGVWSPSVPERPTEGESYLWQKFWNYKESKWEYVCLSGPPSADFSLEINPTTFRLSSRGVTRPDQKISAICRRINTAAPCAWEVQAPATWAYVTSGVDSEIEITIPANRQDVKSITVTCSVADIGITKSFVVTGVQEGQEKTEYLGIYPSLDQVPVSTTEGPLILGDHILVTDLATGARIPYYWTGTQWAIADGSTPASIAFDVFQDTIFDALQAPGTQTIQSVINLFCANLGSFNIFSFYAKFRNLLVGDGNGTAGSGLSVRIYDYQNGQKVTPVFVVLYDDKTLFQIDPASGRIFFGQPDEQLTAPAAGFMYDPENQEIVSANRQTIIKSNGTIECYGLEAKASRITEGYFSGSFDCDVIRTEPAPEVDTGTQWTLSVSVDQAKKLVDEIRTWLNEDQYFSSDLIRVRCPDLPELVFLKASCEVANNGRSANYEVSFLDSYGSGIDLTEYFEVLRRDNAFEDFEPTTAWTPYIQNKNYVSVPNQSIYINQALTIYKVTGGNKLFLNCPISPSEDDLLYNIKEYQVYVDSEGFVHMKF